MSNQSEILALVKQRFSSNKNGEEVNIEYEQLQLLNEILIELQKINDKLESQNAIEMFKSLDGGQK